MVRRVAACVLVMAVVACGAAKRSQMTAAQPPHTAAAPDAAGGQTMPVDDPRAEIDRLFEMVEKERVSAGLPESQADPIATKAQPMSTIPLSTDATCKPAKTEKCTSSCTLSDSICNNADRICKLAADLGDAWAADKCSRAKATCEAAHDSCCNCR